MRGLRRKSLLILLPWPASPFMKTDIDLLGKHFPVEVLTYEGRRLHMALRVLARILAGRVGAVVLWFAVPSFGFGVSVIAKALRCPIALITGGYDVACMPEIGFGSMIRPKLRRLVVAMLNMADVVLTFSDYSQTEVLRYARPRRMLTVYPGVDVNRFRPAEGVSWEQRECMVITASSVGHAFIRQKGLDTFVRAAAYVPEARFVLIGKFVDDAIDMLRAEAPANVEFTGRFLADEEYVRYLQSARVYVQASAHEGFGLSLAEAMAAGCVPVAANVTAMPEVVGEAGFYAPVGNAQAFAEAVRMALRDDGRLSLAAHERIVRHFTLDRRERALVAEMRRLLTHEHNGAPGISEVRTHEGSL